MKAADILAMDRENVVNMIAGRAFGDEIQNLCAV